jgi:site-specific recombinase XerD
MNVRTRDFEKLIFEVSNYLNLNLHFSLKSLKVYRGSWNHFKRFLIENNFKSFNGETVDRFLKHKFGKRHRLELSNSEKEFRTRILRLKEYVQTEQVRPLPCVERRQYEFNGPIGKIFDSYLTHKKFEEAISIIRLNNYKREMMRFFNYLTKRGIKHVEEIDSALILNFLGGLDCTYKTRVIMTTSVLRGLLVYLFEGGHLKTDISRKVPRYRNVNQSKLPSTYSAKELDKVISTIDRSGCKGKRDYAIVLIIVRFGLRASDLVNLKFENLNWERSTIIFNQVKTGKQVQYPLLTDVGNAIIDYLKYGRPESDEQYVFLLERPPYGRMTSTNVITHIVQRAFRRASIDTSGRRSGPRAFRQSLAFRLLEERTTLPVISEILGHQSTESTKYYLRIDLKSMQQCMLDVPPINPNFYSHLKERKIRFYEKRF